MEDNEKRLNENPQETETTATHADTAEEQMPPIDVYSVLGFSLQMLVEQAWVNMGIRVAPGQKETTVDMPAAKIAIDTAAFIADKLESHETEENKKMLRDMISNLQINYVSHNKG